MGENKAGCVESAAGPLEKKAPAVSEQEPTTRKEMKAMTLARVGHTAPDFEANVYHQNGFHTMKLSDFRGKWIVLCFYPGDFTFV